MERKNHHLHGKTESKRSKDLADAVTRLQTSLSKRREEEDGDLTRKAKQNDLCNIPEAITRVGMGQFATTSMANL